MKPAVVAFLKERGLELSEEKTHITHIDDGFDFLGFNVRKYGGKLLIRPSKPTVKRFLDEVRMWIKTPYSDQDGRLDPATQSKDTGLGQPLLSRDCQEDLQPCRLPSVSGTERMDRP